jgi:hypothetical protein
MTGWRCCLDADLRIRHGYRYDGRMHVESCKEVLTFRSASKPMHFPDEKVLECLAQDPRSALWCAVSGKEDPLALDAFELLSNPCPEG